MTPKQRAAYRRKQAARKKRRLIKAAIILLMILAVVAIVGGVLLWVLTSRIDRIESGSDSYADSIVNDPLDPNFSGTIVDDPVNISDTAASVKDIKVQGDTNVIKNILLIGVETGGYDNYIGRSDTMIILSINSYDHTLTLISLMRDLYVTCPGRDKNGDGRDDRVKLNATYAYGGIDLLCKTIEANFRLKIDKCVAVNFKIFSEVVDALGGVDIDLTGPEAEFCEVGNTTKSYHLNGEAALLFARIRYIKDANGNLNDFGRTSRQRILLQAMMDKARTKGVASLISLMWQTFPSIKTNMSQDELLDYVSHAAAYLKYTVKNSYLPQEGEYDALRTNIYGEPADVLSLKNPRDAVLELHHTIYG